MEYRDVVVLNLIDNVTGLRQVGVLPAART
jgi:hypothetical protein